MLYLIKLDGKNQNELLFALFTILKMFTTTSAAHRYILYI